MDDIISRQKAIDIFHVCAPGIPWKKLNEIFSAIPSAQPKEIFEFGKWYDFERGYVLEMTVHSFRILKDMEASSNE